MKIFNKRALAAVLIVMAMLLSSLSAAALTAGDILNEASVVTLDDNGYTVVFEGDMSESEYAFSPSVCVVENGANAGRVIASWDTNSLTQHIPANSSAGNVGHVAYSDDGGKTFTDATLQSDDFLFATVFEAGNALYLMARQSSTRYLVICKSTDGGATWGAFTTLENTCVWHTAPSGAYYRNGQVFLLWENGLSGRASLSPVLWWADVTADLTVVANWSHSLLSFPYSNRVGNNSGNGQRGTYSNTDYLGVPFWGDVTGNLGWLEGSITEIKDTGSDLYDPTGNTLYAYLRGTLANSNYGCIMKFVYNTSTGLWVPLDVQAPSGETLLFTQLPGGNNKFHLTVDEQTGIQWLLASVSSDSMNATQFGNNKRMNDAANERKDLGLYYSSDGLNWTFAGYVSRGEQEIESRNYASMYIYGNDMYVLSRSGDANAASYHNNNLITLHIVKNFRNLTANKSVASKAAGLVVSAQNLGNAAVTNTEIFMDSDGNEWVTCADAEGATVYLKNSDGTYTQSLRSEFQLGEVVEINGRLYVFGCDDSQLVAYQYTENVGWGNHLLVQSGNFAGAPSDVYVKDGRVYIAVDEFENAHPTAFWSAQRGYTGAQGSVTDNGTAATLTGYGAAHYSTATQLEIGDTVSTTLTVLSSNETGGSRIGLFFNDGDTFYSQAANSAYTANGVALELHGNSNQSNSFILRYSKVTGGIIDSQNAGYCSIGLTGGTGVSAQLSTSLYNTPMKVSLTKKSATVYTLSLTTTAAGYSDKVYSADITFDSDIFANGVYLNTGWRYNTNAVNTYTVTHPVKRTVNWAVFQNAMTVETLDNGVSVNAASATGAASANKSVALAAGKSVSTKVTFHLAGNTSTVAAGVAFATRQNMYYGWGDSTGYALGVQFNSGGSGIQYFYMKNGTRNFGNFPNSPIGFNVAADNLTYTVSLTDRGESGYTLNVRLNNTVYSADVPTSIMPANVLTGDLYLNTGNRVKLSAGTYTVENLLATSGNATAIGEKAPYDTYPVVLHTAVSGFSPVASSWTALAGDSFAEKIGDPANANLGLFGLPYETVDPMTVGWKDAKLFAIGGSDATDLRFRYYEAVNNGVGVGLNYGNYDPADNHSGLMMLMPVKNLGKNYAALFMIDDAITTYGTPSGEEMILVRVPGGNYSFDLTYDSVSGAYWLATTEDTDSGDARVSLYYSYNAYDWLYAGLVATGLSGDAHVALAINDLDLTVTADIGGIKAFRIPLFRSLTGEYRDLDNWQNTRGFTSSTLQTENGVASFNGMGGARIATPMDMPEGTSVSFAVGTSSDKWTAGGKFTVGLLNADNSFVGGGADTGSGFIVDIINNNGISANMYLYTVTDGMASGSGAVAANKVNTKTFTEAQITGDGIQIVFTRHTHKDGNGNDCAWMVSVLQSDNVVLQKSIPVSQVAANLFDDGAYFIAGARYGAAVQYTISNLATYRLSNGDLNADFAFNALDLASLSAILLQDEDEGIGCDVNDDGAVNILDLIRMKKMLAAIG